jgi:hypothetical protein
MAQWKISVKQSGSINGVRIEKGMFVEMVTNSVCSPSLFANKSLIGQLFLNKYGVDLLEAGLITSTNLTCERAK